MPRLARLRLICIGHPNARFDDVTLNFQDHQGRPIDSTLWLRNGGGKSSILNLFFAVVRPDKREFLGGKADAKKRKIEDYIQNEDRSVVVCEWEADAERDSLGLEGTEGRLLTGVFYEWRSGAADLRRLFFGCRIAAEQKELTLDGLPIYRMEQGKRKARRNMTAFKQHWSELRDAQPHLSIFATEQQVEWAEWLSAARIDPDLFSYQVRMNHREGGADDLFRFDEAEQFVDFLLDLVLDPRHAEAVRKNIETFRCELKERSQTLIPMRELVSGLISKLEPIEILCQRRDSLNARASAAAGRLSLAQASLDRKIKSCAAEQAERAASAERFSRKQRESTEQARVLGRRLAWLDRHLAEQHVANAQTEFQESQARMQEALRNHRLWQAAIPLRDALRFEWTAREYLADLERKNKEHAPLARELEEAAAQYASALSWQQEAVKKDQQEAEAQETECRNSASLLRKEAGEARQQAARCDAEAKALEGRLKEAKKALDVLRKQHVIGDSEAPESAMERLKRELSEIDRKIAENSERQSTLASDRIQFEAEKESMAGELAKNQQRLEHALGERNEAIQRRTQLEASEALRRRLQVDAIELEEAAEHVVETLRRQRLDESERLVELRIELVSSERAISSLEQTGLLPPSQDAEKVVRAIRQRFNGVWSGWAYLSENAPETPIARRMIIECCPHAVMGVVVADKEFTEACALAKAERLRLDSPVVIIKQSDFGAEGKALGMVIGPYSDAYHSKAAAKEELIRRRHDADASGRKLDDLAGLNAETDNLLRLLESFIERYPKGWFQKHESEIQKLQAAERRTHERLLSIGASIKGIDQDLSALRLKAQEFQGVKSGLEKKAFRLDEYVVQFGSKLADWQEGMTEARQRMLRQIQKAEGSEEAAALAEDRAADAVARRMRLNQEAHDLAGRMARVQPRVKGEMPKARKGDLDRLETSFQHLESVFEKTVDEAGLRKAAQENAVNARRCRAKLADAIGDLKEAEVAKTLSTLTDPELAERRLGEANDLQVSARGAHGNAKKRLDDFRQRLKDAEAPCLEQAVTDRDRPRDEGDLASITASEQAAVRYRAEVQRLTAAAQESERQAAENERSAEHFKNQGDLAIKDAQTLAQTRARFEHLLSGRPASLPDDAPAELDVDRSLKELESVLSALQAEKSGIDDELRTCTAQIRAWVGESRFQVLKSDLVQRFLAMNEAAIERDARQINPELALHLQVIEQQIAEKDKHRELLVQEMWGATEEGLSLLTQAERRSRLPDSLPGLGGSQFLHISLNTPPDPAGRKDRLGELVDEWVNSGEVPSAMGIIHEAVRRLARPIKVRVLNPDPDLKTQSVDISDMSRFSGGERLTCAILLYCTLAQLRARHRGMTRSPSSVLLLDNPIGRASRPKFLELQRAVAKEMGVQLIYTTGVDDYSAINALPNMVRLKNSRVNLGTGQRHVEIENGAGSIEAAQISRKEAS